MGRSLIAVPRLGIRLRSPPLPRANHIAYTVKPSPAKPRQPTFSSHGDEPADDDDDQSGPAGNRVMVVVDSSLDSEGALEWALSHAVHTQQDSIVLLQVVKPSSKDHSGKFKHGDHHETLHSMRSMCKSGRPSVKVEVVIIEGEKKGQIIVEEAKRNRVSLLVLGRRRRRPMMWRLLRQCWRWPGKRSCRRLGTVEYCIQNADCLAVAVRRKSKKLGGYLITTKRHKNFWLLA